MLLTNDRLASLRQFWNLGKPGFKKHHCLLISHTLEYGSEDYFDISKYRSKEIAQILFWAVFSLIHFWRSSWAVGHLLVKGRRASRISWLRAKMTRWGLICVISIGLPQ